MKGVYVETILLIERLHRRFLDVVKEELDRLRIDDVNNVQTLILYNIGDEHLTVGELTNRGYYLGSNVSYNVKKLVENEYLIQEQSKHDKRSFRVKLSEKGLGLCEKIDTLYGAHIQRMDGNISLQDLNKQLLELEEFWATQVRRF